MPAPTYLSSISTLGGTDASEITVSLATVGDNKPTLIVIGVQTIRNMQMKAGTTGWTKIAGDGTFWSIWIKDTAVSEPNPVFQTTDVSSSDMCAFVWGFTGNTSPWATKQPSVAIAEDVIDPPSVTISPSSTGLALALYGSEDARRVVSASGQPSGYGTLTEQDNGGSGDVYMAWAPKSITSAQASEDPGTWTDNGGPTTVKNVGTIFIYESGAPVNATYGFGSETDTTPGFVASVVLTENYGFGPEASAAFAFTATVQQSDNYGFGAETDTGFAFAATTFLTDSYGFGPETNTGFGFEASAALSDNYDFGAETDTSFAFAATIFLTDSFGFSAETDASFSFDATVQQSDNFGFGAETNAAFGFNATAFLTDDFGFGPETNAAFGFNSTVFLDATYGFGPETDAAFAFQADLPAAVDAQYGFSAEVDTSPGFIAANANPPVYIGTNAKTSGTMSSTTGINVTLPSGISAGEVIMVVATIDGTVNPVDPAVFRRLGWTTFGGASLLIGYVDSDDILPSPPATINFKSNGTTVNTVWITFRVANTEDPDISPPEISSNLTYSSGTPDPPAVTPSGGSKDYLAVTVTHINRSTTQVTINAYPSGYVNTDFLDFGSGTSGVMVGMGTRTFSGTTEDPGPWTLSTVPTVPSGSVQTIALYPLLSLDATFGFGAETDAGFPFVATSFLSDNYGFGPEANLSTGFIANVNVTENYGFGSETDTAFGFVAVFVINATYGFGAETDTSVGFQATVQQSDNYGFGVETDSAFAFQADLPAAPVNALYGFGAETDATFDFFETLGGALDAAYAFATETAFVFGFVAQSGPVDDTFFYAEELNSALSFTATIQVTDQDAFYGFGNELDIALSFSAYNDVEVQPSPQGNLDFARWGCGEWTVWVADRFGNPRQQLDNVTSISGSPLRIVDNVSQVTITLGEGCNVDNLLCQVEPWASEIQVRLDGRIQWAGPLQDVDFEHGPDVDSPVTLEAKDLLQWLAVRVLRGRIAAGPIAQQFATIVNQAMVGDNIGLVAPTGFVSVDGKLRITDVTSALDEIVDLAPFLDFTMLGRDLLVGGEEIPFSTLPHLILPDHSKTYNLKRIGSDEASQVWMRGGEDFEHREFDRAVGAYPPSTAKKDPKIGIVQRRFYDTSILESNIASTAAYSYYQYAKPPVWALTVTLDMSRAPFRFDDLIAGSIVPVNVANVSCFQNDDRPEDAEVSGRTGTERIMRIRTIDLNVSDEGEEVTIDLIPAGIYQEGFARLSTS